MRWLLTSLIAIIGGFAGAALFSASGLGDAQTRAYLLANPEVLPEAMEELQLRQMQSRIAPLRTELEAPFPGAVLGNPQGTVTLVEFTDYACSFCRQSLADVSELIAANPDLRVVIREYPILTADSADAARMALAAAQQGRFEQFHMAMFGQGQVTPETIEAAASEAGIDLAAARSAIEAGQFEGQLQNNVYMARTLGITGTPAWIVGDRALDGAVGADAIGRAIADARDS
ncbi:DsbA family protein [Alteraurantiacibacter aquimixticola]|uniref:DsbA family protein n=1 Tax=Alteraurantiacibacter aquimixticola TaxID=2489173 RepID=A0A4T3EWZ1_9SPHN|nr:DsbA family protein [Alteraurantiacibacter aquimixticola]TIX49086.1 DsbA family protein [Alteraurantiacibacter aquimixticola]